MAIGYPISDVSIQSAVAATVYDIAILASVSTASRLADEKSFPYFTRIGADAAEQTVAVKDAILYYNSINGGGWTNVGIISTINEITTDFAETFSAVAGPEIDVVTYQQFLFGTEDLSVELNELKNSGARVFLGMIFGEWERFAELANEFGLMGEGYVWFVPPQTVGVPFSAPSEVSRGILGVNDFFPKTSPFTECFTKAWGSADPTKYTLAGNGGIPPPTLTYRAFDTVMIAAIAIDKVDKMGLLESGERVPAQTWNDVMRNITFDGLSGFIEFKPNGDRIGTHSILYYQPETGWTISAVWSAEDGYEVITDVVWADNTTNVPDLDIRDPFKYWSCHNKEEKYDPSGKRVTLHTPDSSDVDDIDIDYHCDNFIDCQNLSDESYDCSSNYTILFIVFGIITGLLICISLILLIFVCIFGCILKYRRVRVASPFFLIVILLSMIVGYSSIYAWFGKPHPVACAFQPWLLGLPVISMIAALTVKNFRIWRIFKFPMEKLRISDLELLVLWSIVMIPGILIVILWTIISTPTAKMEERDGEDHYVCTTGGFTGEPGGLVFFFIFVGYSAIVLVFGAIISILSRKAPSQFNESKLMTISIYNLGFLSVVIIPVFLVVQPFNPFIAWILRTCAILYAFTATMVLQFLPQLVGIFIIDKGRNVKKFKSKLSKPSQSSGTTGIASKTGNSDSTLADSLQT